MGELELFLEVTMDFWLIRETRSDGHIARVPLQLKRSTVMDTIRKIVCCFVLIALQAQAVQALTIAENGQAQAVIAVAAGAPLPEQHAAQELARFLNQITGAEFAVQNQSAEDRPCLLVGADMARTADLQFKPEELGQDGIVIRTVGNKVILAGGYPRGTLYAVYTFLEEQLGCRWWSSAVSTIPSRPTIVLSDLNLKYIPPLEYRESFWTDAFDGDWAARNKCNGASERLEEKHGGKHIYEGFVHTFYPLIPPDRYFLQVHKQLSVLLKYFQGYELSFQTYILLCNYAFL